MDPIELKRFYEQYQGKEEIRRQRALWYHAAPWITCTTQSVMVSGFTPAHDEPEEDDDDEDDYEKEICLLWVL